MNKLIGLLTIGLISVAGCTTSPVENVDYFILSNGDIPNSTQARTQQKAKILVDKVSLPSYLDTSNMAMQLNDHQLYYSKQHFWAEPLKIGIVNALVEDLNGDDAKHHYVDSIDDIAEGKYPRISVHIKQFMPTSGSTVKLNGQYWLISADSKLNKADAHTFAFEADLNEDGYPHAVKKMRMLLQQLSKDVLKNIEK